MLQMLNLKTLECIWPNLYHTRFQTGTRANLKQVMSYPTYPIPYNTYTSSI
jgi:hypothetical protein